jgi:hypothetical protein
VAEHDDGGDGEQQHQRRKSDQRGAARADQQAPRYGDGAAHQTTAPAALCGLMARGIGKAGDFVGRRAMRQNYRLGSGAQTTGM